MSREYHYAIKFDEEDNLWYLDTDTEEAVFPNGTIYNSITGEWEYGYTGDGKYTGREDELCQIISNMLDNINTSAKEKE